MESATEGRVWAALLLIVWLSQVIYLFPVPTAAIELAAQSARELSEKNQTAVQFMDQKNDGQVNEEDTAQSIKTELWRGWFTKVGILLVGLASVAMAFYSIRFWRLAIVVSAVFYLAVWLIDAGIASMSLMRSYEIKWMYAKMANTVPTFVHRDLLLPFFFLGVIAFIAMGIMRGNR